MRRLASGLLGIHKDDLPRLRHCHAHARICRQLGRIQHSERGSALQRHRDSNKLICGLSGDLKTAAGQCNPDQHICRFAQRLFLTDHEKTEQRHCRNLVGTVKAFAGRNDDPSHPSRKPDRPQTDFSRVRYNRAGRESIDGTKAKARPAPPRDENANTGICIVHARPREARP